MGKTMAAMALSFLMAMGGEVAFANSNGQGSSSSKAPTSQTSAQRQAPANNPGPIGFAEEEIQTGPLTVERIDKQNRNMVVQGPDGTQSTVNIPSGTPGFDSLKKGDQIQFDYFDAAVVGPGANQANPSNQAAPSSSMGNHAPPSTSSSNNGQHPATGASNRTVRSIRKVNR